MKKKNFYLLGMVVSIIMCIFGTGIYIYLFPCTRITGTLLFIYSFTTACVAVMFYEQYMTQKAYEKRKF